MTSRHISRKEFLGIGAGAAAGVALAGSGMATFLSKEAGALTSFKPFTVSLPIPPKAVEDADGVIRLFAQQSTQAMHPRLPKVKVWGYNQVDPDPTLPPEYNKTSGYLGPTIEVDKNGPNPTNVEFTNNLPPTHLLPVDDNLPRPDGGTERGTSPRILTHLHGSFVDGDNDGNPYATQNEYETGSVAGATQSVTYPSQPRATMLWYHDHAMAMTRLNVYAGLAGFFLVRDNNDTGGEDNPIGIPGGPYEVPILIQDKSFTSGGQLFYSATAEWIPEFFGNTPVVNGAVRPFLTVEPRMYRLRFLNGSQSRFYNLEMAIGDANAALLPDRLRGRHVRRTGANQPDPAFACRASRRDSGFQGPRRPEYRAQEPLAAQGSDQPRYAEDTEPDAVPGPWDGQHARADVDPDPAARLQAEPSRLRRRQDPLHHPRRGP
ncbi:MAG TPA: multicopper oxidase domain-containing protein [Rubrobacter sp.]|nr:multicopper oxidase domain-containing protein [Rubrobacter sp.]